jgi:hypothetical protein
MPFILHTEEGRTCPRFKCDCCGQFIADASRALLIWDDYKDGTWIPKVVCKGECDHLIERTMKSYPMSMELDTALMFLLNNSGMSKEAVAGARQKAMLLGGL